MSSSGWFWHGGAKPRFEAPDAVDLYGLQCIGLGAGLILNLPPSTSGVVERPFVEFASQFKQEYGKRFGAAGLVGGTHATAALATDRGAENGVLTVMCGGTQKDFDTAKPAIMSYARACELLGEAGSGQIAKMVNQICIAGLVQGLSEALHFAQSAGLDGRKVVDTISKGAAQSWQMENRYETMLDDQFEFGFAVDWMRKDLGICLEQAKRMGISLPVTAVVDQFYGDVQAMGGGRWDTSSLIRRLRQLKKSYD